MMSTPCRYAPTPASATLPIPSPLPQGTGSIVLLPRVDLAIRRLTPDDAFHVSICRRFANPHGGIAGARLGPDRQRRAIAVLAVRRDPVVLACGNFRDRRVQLTAQPSGVHGDDAGGPVAGIVHLPGVGAGHAGGRVHRAPQRATARRCCTSRSPRCRPPPHRSPHLHQRGRAISGAPARRACSAWGCGGPAARGSM
jgi:hypothetical protein